MEPSRIVEIAALAAQDGSSPVAVLPMRRHDGTERFACAFAVGDARGWLVVDGTGSPVEDVGEVRDVTELIAMCEAAEEAAGALAAAEALERLAGLETLAVDRPDAALALRALREALAPLAVERPGVRVADASYLDELAGAAAIVGDRFDLLKEAALASTAGLTGVAGEDGEELAEGLWNLVRLLARDGAPDRFREAVEGAMGPASAFADDVLANYLGKLEAQ